MKRRGIALGYGWLVLASTGACSDSLIVLSSTAESSTSGAAGATEAGVQPGTGAGAGGASSGPDASGRELLPKGLHCSADAECAPPLVCAGGRCHATCDPAAGCHGGSRVLPCLTEFAAVPVCPLPCDTGWGADSSLCAHAGEPSDGPPNLYDCSSIPDFYSPPPGNCAGNADPCGETCLKGAETLREVCDRGVCNCTYNGAFTCRCLTADLPSACSFCCN